MKAVFKRQMAEGLVCIGLFVVWVIKLRMGLHADEVYSVTLGTMLAQDTQLFKECWSSLQLSALIEVPPGQIVSVVSWRTGWDSAVFQNDVSSDTGADCFFSVQII